MRSLGKAPLGIPQALGCLVAAIVLGTLQLLNVHIGPASFQFNLLATITFLVLSLAIALFSLWHRWRTRSKS